MSELSAKFKQASVKDGGTAMLQFDVAVGTESFLDAVRLVGERVTITIEPAQQKIQFDEPEEYEEYEVEVARSGRSMLPEVSA